jgi:hypothetical protein
MHCCYANRPHLHPRAARRPEAEALRELGLSEGSGNVHPGQGTANRRFFFANAFLELLWIADEEEIRNGQTRPTMLHERLSAAKPRHSASASAPTPSSPPGTISPLTCPPG